MAPPVLRDRLLTALCVVGAVAVLAGGLARGNPRGAVVGALLLLGYAVLASVTRRLTPRLTGDERDHAERMAQFRATRLAGQAALLVAAVGLALELGVQWEPGLWVAGATLVVVVTFVAALAYHGSRARSHHGSRAARGPGRR